ncbi:MAG: acyltransferase [Desulfobulbaceae bacterium]|jgi:peptidoglycan/LPS O-acetylase OafA/YrhL|nr:acyltransferase [Desulfobulbaceae bacterium]
MRLSIFFRLAAAIAVFVCLRQLTVMLCLASQAGLAVDCQFSQSDRLALYWRFSGAFKEKARISQPVGSERQVVKLILKDEMLRQFRLDLGAKPGIIKIQRISLASHFGKEQTWLPEEIRRDFQPNSDIAAINVQGDHLEIMTKGGNPYLVSPIIHPYRNIGIAWLLPLVFAALFFLYLPDMIAAIRRLPVFDDLRDRGNPGNIAALDGLRGLAALAVLAEHTGILPGIGSLGVYLFFALSGFLLTRPFRDKPERAADFAYMRRYLLRRLQRILPMYYLFITVTMLLRGHSGAAIRHYLFLQGDSHLWTLPQEMFFYAILPLVVLGIFALKDLPKFVTALFLLALIAIAATHWGMNIVHFYGYGTSLPSRAGIFLAGVFFACCYDGPRAKNWPDTGKNAIILTTIALLAVLVALSGKLIFVRWGINFLSWPISCGFLCGLLVFLTAFASGTALDRLLANPALRLIGIVGFSFYLVHPWLLGFIKNAALALPIPQTSLFKFTLGGIGTLVVASFTYSFVERPFIDNKAAKKG